MANTTIDLRSAPSFTDFAKNVNLASEKLKDKDSKFTLSTQARVIQAHGRLWTILTNILATFFKNIEQTNNPLKTAQKVKALVEARKDIPTPDKPEYDAFLSDLKVVLKKGLFLDDEGQVTNKKYAKKAAEITSLYNQILNIVAPGEELRDLEKRIAKKGDEIANATKQIAEAEGKAKDIQVEIDALQGKTGDEDKKKLAELQTQLSANAKSLEDLKKSSDELTKVKADLEKKLKETEEKLQKETEIKNATAALESAKKALADAKTPFDKAQLDKLEEAIKAAEKQAQEADVALNAATVKHNELEANVADVTGQIAAKEAEVKASAEALVDAEEALKNATKTQSDAAEALAKDDQNPDLKDDKDAADRGLADAGVAHEARQKEHVANQEALAKLQKDLAPHKEAHAAAKATLEKAQATSEAAIKTRDTADDEIQALKVKQSKQPAEIEAEVKQLEEAVKAAQETLNKLNTTPAK